MTHFELLDNEEGMDELSGDRYFISTYKISADDKNALINNSDFTKLANPHIFAGTKLQTYLEYDGQYLYKKIESGKEVNYIIVDTKKILLVFAKFTFEGEKKEFM